MIINFEPVAFFQRVPDSSQYSTSKFCMCFAIRAGTARRA